MGVVYQSADSTTASGASSNLSKACAYPGNIAIGDLLTCSVVCIQAVTPTISGWTAIGSSIAAAGNLRLTCFYLFATSALTGNFTVSLGGGSESRIDAHRFTGAGGIRGYVTATLSANSAITGSPGATVANELAWSVSGAYDGSFGGFTVAGTGWSLATSGTNGNSWAAVTASKTAASSTSCIHQYGTGIDDLCVASWVIVPPRSSGLFFGSNF
jgi:hypothetical protein